MEIGLQSSPERGVTETVKQRHPTDEKARDDDNEVGQTRTDDNTVSDPERQEY
ncbi:hypothetical protein JCM18750_36790 [Halostagnicola bangensis]